VGLLEGKRRAHQDDDRLDKGRARRSVTIIIEPCSQRDLVAGMATIFGSGA
jgi:hypothetical protein